MDGVRFDNLSRSLASRSNRRVAVQRLGGGGLLGAVLGATGLRSAAAQGDGQTCKLAVSAVVSAGPSAEFTLDGDLTLVIGDDGAIDEGQWRSSNGDTFDVVGQATGRAVSLFVDLGDGTSLALTGVGEQDLALCRGNVAGTVGGPELGDVGSWQARRAGNGNGGGNGSGNGSDGGTGSSGGSSGSSSGGNSGGSSGSGSGSGNGSGDSGGSGSGGGTSCQDQPCSSSQVWDADQCACRCPGNYEACGDVCCPGGSVCSDPSQGECQCPGTFEICQDRCVPSCEFGGTLDQDSCECVVSGGSGGGAVVCGATTCTPFGSVPTTDLYCQGAACVCQYECAAACDGGTSGAYFTIECGNNPSDYCTYFGCFA